MRYAHLWLMAAVTGVAGCHSAPPAPPRPETAPGAAPARGPERVALRGGWNATLRYRRQDSIILALPSGDRQVQQLGSTARFTLNLGAGSTVSVRLDSLGFTPPVTGTAAVAGVIWSGRLTGSRVGDLTTSRTGPLIADLGPAVEGLFPRLPVGGVEAGMRWTDSATVSRQVDIFSTIEDRHAQWAAGQPVMRDGLRVLPLTVREVVEQRGEGTQGGRTMRMTAQGIRSSTYYLTMDGRLDGLVQRDSIAMLISIPSARQVVPTVRIGRVEVKSGT
jgi:hypothetical protein